MDLKGKILKLTDPSVKFGMYITRLEHDKSKNEIYGKVCYFPLDQIGTRGGWNKVVTRDDQFLMPMDMFEDSFEILLNPDGLMSFDEAKWAPIKRKAEK